MGDETYTLTVDQLLTVAVMGAGTGADRVTALFGYDHADRERVADLVMTELRAGLDDPAFRSDVLDLLGQALAGESINRQVLHPLRPEG